MCSLKELSYEYFQEVCGEKGWVVYGFITAAVGHEDFIR